MQYNSSRYNEQQYQYLQLSELLVLSDIISKDIAKGLADNIFLSDLLTKQVTSKTLPETILLHDWQSHKQINEEWFD